MRANANNAVAGGDARATRRIAPTHCSHCRCEPWTCAQPGPGVATARYLALAAIGAIAAAPAAPRNDSRSAARDMNPPLSPFSEGGKNQTPFRKGGEGGFPPRQGRGHRALTPVRPQAGCSAAIRTTGLEARPHHAVRHVFLPPATARGTIWAITRPPTRRGGTAKERNHRGYADAARLAQAL